MKWPRLPIIPLLLSCCGCLHRTIEVTSDPPGALVILKDQEAGRTPFKTEFKWYGVYDIELSKDGYEPIKTTAPIIAPWWQWVPFDLFTEMLPIEDRHELNYTMVAPTTRQTDPELLLRRGEDLRGKLQSSERPTTQPTTQPTTRPTTRPATRPVRRRR